jgi:threonine dehydrogenase-like Zn-dependent dehydrogenase
VTLALTLHRSIPRYIAARAVGSRLPGLLSGPVAPLKLGTVDEPELPGPGWARVGVHLAGICGSDLAMLSGRSSFYFEPLVSMPFVPGHEIVGELLDDIEELRAGTRVVIDPVLSCWTRAVEPCVSCAAGLTERCDRITSGHIAPGLQTGYCADTGGGWSEVLVAHRSQVHVVPNSVSDRRAVLIEPLACALHAVLRAHPAPGDSVSVVGAGTLGLLTLIALRRLTHPGRITVVAKHAHQAELASKYGADEVVTPDTAARAIRRAAQGFLLRPVRGRDFLLGGVDVAFECAGSPTSLELALSTTRAGGRVCLVGLPGGGVDLSAVWFRELELIGAYASGMEKVNGRRSHAFDIAVEVAQEVAIDELLSATYPLEAWRDAIDHALEGGRLAAVKIAFDLKEGVS